MEVVTKLYDSEGRHVADQVDRYHVVDRRDGQQYQMSQKPKQQKPKQSQTPPPPEHPLVAQRIRTMREAKRAVLETLSTDVPVAPDTLGEVVKLQQAQGLRYGTDND